MLKQNQLVEMHWHPKNIQYYIDKGYVYTKTKEKFMVKVEDLPLQSHVPVVVICDYCGEEYTYKYQNYNNQCSKHLGDACPKCKYKKLKNSVKEKYGVNTVFELEQIKNKAKCTFINKYGVTHYSKTDEYKSKTKNTYLSHIKDGSIKAPVSSQQIQIHQILKDIFGNSELNYPCGRCLLDCMVIVNGCKVDVEYDGLFWHQGKEEYDRKRNYYVISNGYKVLRIKGKHKIPTKQQIKNFVEELVNSETQFKEIQIE